VPDFGSSASSRGPFSPLARISILKPGGSLRVSRRISAMADRAQKLAAKSTRVKMRMAWAGIMRFSGYVLAISLLRAGAALELEDDPLEIRPRLDSLDPRFACARRWRREGSRAGDSIPRAATRF